MNNPDPYFKKIVQYNYRDHNLQFRVSQSLFSSDVVDIGTQRLLRTLTTEGFNTFDKALDLGCGYGPLGIALKSVCPQATLHMVDRDALALEFSRQNAELNGVKDVKVYGSLGYDGVSDTDFDLIVSNIPAKVGEPVLSHMLQDAQHHLRKDGRVAVVVIDAIAEYVTKVLTTDPNINILFHKSWPGHHIFHYEFPSGKTPDRKLKINAFDSEIYDRDQKAVSLGSFDINIQTTYGLPEFDTLSYETELVLGRLPKLKNYNINKAIIFNSGQGFIPVALSKATKVGQILLIGRDLLALRVSQRNLKLSGFTSNNISLLHQIDISQTTFDKTDCIIGIFTEKENPDVNAMFVRQAAAQIANGGVILFASSSTSIKRVETLIRAEKLLNISEQLKSRGKVVLILKPKL